MLAIAPYILASFYQTSECSLCLPSWVCWSALSADLAQCSSCMLQATGYVLTASCLLLWSLSCPEAWILSQMGGRCRGNNPRLVWHPRPMCSLCPVYRICSSIFFSIFQLFCSATLRVESQSLLTEGDWHLCAQLLCLPALWLDRTLGTNSCYFCLRVFLLNYLLLGLYKYSMSPVPFRLGYWRSWTILILGNTCFHWSWACRKFPACEGWAFRSLRISSYCGL